MRPAEVSLTIGASLDMVILRRLSMVNSMAISNRSHCWGCMLPELAFSATRDGRVGSCLDNASVSASSSPHDKHGEAREGLRCWSCTPDVQTVQFMLAP